MRRGLLTIHYSGKYFSLGPDKYYIALSIYGIRAVHMREEPNNPMPNLWRYRSPLSLEHFAQSFGMAEPAIREKCPLIGMFLKEKSSLFVTRFLPDIVELQLRLGERFQHRLSKREASNTTIEGFLNNMERGISVVCAQIFHRDSE